MKNEHEINRIGYIPEQEQTDSSKEHNKMAASTSQNEREQISQSGDARHLNRKQISLLRLSLLAGCLAVFVFCSVKLVGYFSDIHKSKSASQEISQLYEEAEQEVLTESSMEPTAQAMEASPVPIGTEAPGTEKIFQPKELPSDSNDAQTLWPQSYKENRTLRISATFYQLQQKNPDIVGWLEIPGIVKEPVLLKDNEFYMTHNSLREKSVTGALFLDEGTDMRIPPAQFIIYGHNMKEGSMFGSLKKYKVKDSGFYHNNAYVTFNTEYENGEYVIFAVCEISIAPSSSRYLPFWQYHRFTSAEQFEHYVKSLMDLSHFHTNVDVVPGDRLLLLSTCLGSDDNARLLVAARRIRENEDRTALNMAVMTTTDR